MGNEIIGSDTKRTIKRVKFDVTVTAGQTSKEVTIDKEFCNGLTKLFLFTLPALDDSDTAELKLLSYGDDKEIYASGEEAESQTATLDTERPFMRGMKLKVEISKAQGAGKSFVVDVYFL